MCLLAAAQIADWTSVAWSSEFMPGNALPSGYKMVHSKSSTVSHKRTGQTVTSLKWLGSDAAGKAVAGKIAVSGNKVLADGGEKLARQERLARWQLHGAIDDGAAAHFAVLAAANTDTPLGYFATVAQPDSFCDKGRPSSQQCLAAVAVGDEARFAQVKAAAVAVGASVTWHNGPFFSGKAKPSQLLALKHDPLFASISLEPGSPEPTSLSTVWGNSIYGWNTGVVALGVKVCLLEGYAPKSASPFMSGLGFQGIRFPDGAQNSHANEMSALLFGSFAPEGIAQQASTWVANWKWPYWEQTGPAGSYLPFPWWTALDFCRDRETTVWNFSQKHQTGADLNPAEPMVDDRYFDYMALQPPYPTIVASAANEGTGLFVHNKLRNGLVVGGSQEGPAQYSSSCGEYAPSANRQAHTIWGDFPSAGSSNVGSQGKNPTTAHNDWELPHLVAPATSGCLAVPTLPVGTGTGGTSAATALVSGAIAQIQQVNSELKAWPEACRAIVMATADEDVDAVPLNLTDGHDDKDGAGELNVAAAVVLAAPTNHVEFPQSSGVAAGFAYGTFNFQNPAQFLPPEYSWQPFQFAIDYKISTSFSQQIRVILAWNSTPMCYDEATCTANEAVVPDLDLHVLNQATGAYVQTSTSYDSNYEVIQFNAVAGETYQVRFLWFGGGSHSWYAIAWAPNAI